MPLINVKLIREPGLTEAKKAELIKNLTQALVQTLGKDPAKTWVTIDEVEAENWGVGGESVKARLAGS